MQSSVRSKEAKNKSARHRANMLRAHVLMNKMAALSYISWLRCWLLRSSPQVFFVPCCDVGFSVSHPYSANLGF